jgi:hypothetical protein
MLKLASDPWGTALVVAAGLCALAVLWWMLAVMMRQPARGAGRMLSLGLFAYLGIAAGGTAARVFAAPPPAPPPAPSGPPTVLRADVPHDPDRGRKPPAGKPSTPARPEDAEPAEDAPPEPVTPSSDVAPARPAVTPPASAHVDLGPPTLAGKAALRFVDDVSHDPERCRDVDEIAKAARELPGALSEVAAARAGKAASKLEGCRRKLVWSRAYLVRSKRVDDRKRFADELPARMKSENGLTVLVSLRGAASERIRIGGTGLDEARAKRLLDGGLRDELADFGFAELVLANMKSSVKQTLDAPSDIELAERELAPKGLDRKIELR